MEITGKSLTFNGKNIYHERNKPIASDILFTDGKTLQQKLDDGSLKGDKGEIGEIGPQGPKGDTGEQGPQGPQGETPSIAHLEANISNKISEVDELIHQLTNNRTIDGGEL